MSQCEVRTKSNAQNPIDTFRDNSHWLSFQQNIYNRPPFIMLQ